MNLKTALVVCLVLVGCGEPGSGGGGGDLGGGGNSRGFGYLPPSSAQLDGMSQDTDPRLDSALDPRMGATMVEVKASVDLRPSLPGVLDQGQMGSCAAFANAVVGSLARSRADGTAQVVSTAFLYERQLQLSRTQCKDGTFLHTGLETLMTEGAPLLSEAPYSDQACTSGTNAGNAATRSRIGGYNKLEPWNRLRVRQTLSSGVPVPFGASVPPNFMDFKGGGNFKSDTTGNAGGQHGGGHAMVIIGYDDARGAYLIQNSWGAAWGDQGYVWWDYADLESREGLHGFVPTLLPNGMVVDPNPNMGAFALTVTGAAQFQLDGVTAMAMRLQGNGVFTLKNVSVPALSISDDLDEEALYTDVYFLLSEPVASGRYEASIAIEVGTQVETKTLSFELGELIVLE